MKKNIISIVLLLGNCIFASNNATKNNNDLNSKFSDRGKKLYVLSNF